MGLGGGENAGKDEGSGKIFGAAYSDESASNKRRLGEHVVVRRGRSA